MNTKNLNKKVIIRSDRAGVFYGTLKNVEPLGDKLQVELLDSRRVFYWTGAASLSQLAIDGSKRPSECKITMVVPQMIISGVIEIIPCSDNAIININNIKEWKL